MKLKIDKIQELIDSIDYPMKPGVFQYIYFSGQGGKRAKYLREAENIYFASLIVDNLISCYINNYQGAQFSEIYRPLLYDSLDKESFGFHIGIPYYKVVPIDEACEYSSRYLKEQIEKYYYNRHNISVSPIAELIDEGWITIDTIDDNTKMVNLPIEGKEYLDLLYKELITKQYNIIARQFESAQQEKINEAQKHKQAYIENDAVSEFLCFILKDSFYPFEFDCSPKMDYNKDNKLLVVDYYLPTIDEIPNIKEIKEYKTKDNEIKYLSKTELNRLYDELIYKILIRSVAEIFHFDDLKKVDVVCFNGRVKSRNPATGQLMDNCILSVQICRQEFESIDLNYVDCKACFKHFKGVSGAKLHDMSPIVPLIQLDTTDKRFVESHSVSIDESTNLATMDWEDFEHLVRELFDLEFNVNGGEVKITQASRDGGVDAIAFDPDPIRGGKIVIQAKRYTNTVGVSAVRDLYGTVINEGANKGILITTSDYGADSYNFAKGKPLTLLNGGHLLFLLEKHNKKARIDLREAKNTTYTPTKSPSSTQ